MPPAKSRPMKPFSVMSRLSPGRGANRFMPKQCSECGNIMNDEAPRCDSCGAGSWTVVPKQRIGPKVLRWISVLLVIGLIAFMYRLLVSGSR